MSERLEMLRFLERVQQQDLTRTRRWIAEEEQREADRARGAAARPPAPDWLLEVGIGRDRLPVAVHVGGCHMAPTRVRPISGDQALRALAEGVEACQHCRPDVDLHYIEG